MAPHDDELLRRFVAARDAGDAADARRWWTELVERSHDRVAAMVALWGRGGRLSADEQEDAVQKALLKLWQNMVDTFQGATMGEWVNAVRTCVGYACLDVQRAAARRSGRELALEESAPVAALAQQEHDREAERADAARFVGWALERMRHERRRRVIERTLDGVPAEAIAEELGVSMDNLYQLRSRGLTDLATLKERYDA